MTFYLKYRPQTIDQLDLASVRDSLKKIITSENIPHAFLFSGPRGTGKTSAARVLAKILNCQNLSKDGEPCNKCSSCLAVTAGSDMDVIELDAASNRGIDDIRSLRENVLLAPSSGKKKIYILDEAHMLTTEAANAFLKTLEEPPEHVVFVLATTDAHKLPETVRSRLTNIVFTKATADEVKRQLGRVMEGEKIEADEGALETIAKAADGSFRDAVKMLEQLVAIGGKKISQEYADETLFQSKLHNVDFLYESLIAKDLEKCIAEIERVINQGGSVRKYIDLLFSKIHTDIISSDSKEDLVLLADLLLEAKREIGNSPIPQLPLELSVIKWCQKESKKKAAEVKKNPEIASEQVSKPEENIAETKISESAVPSTIQAEIKPLEQNINLKPVPQADDLIANWLRFKNSIRQKSGTLDTLLRASKPISYDGKNLKIGVFYKLHQEKLSSVSVKQVLNESANEIFGDEVEVVCLLREDERPVFEKSDNIELTQDISQDIMQLAQEVFK